MDYLRISVIGAFTLLVGATVYYFVEQDKHEIEPPSASTQSLSYPASPYLTPSTTTTLSTTPASSSAVTAPAAETQPAESTSASEQAQIDLLKEQLAEKEKQILSAEKEKERYLEQANAHKEEAMVFKEELQEQQSAEPTDTGSTSFVEEDAKARKFRDRSKLIESALLMARIVEYDPNTGIVGMRLVRPQNLRVGEKLSIRRQTDHGVGLMGWIELTNIIDSETAAGQVIPASFHGGMIEVSIGDELILKP